MSSALDFSTLLDQGGEERMPRGVTRTLRRRAGAGLACAAALVTVLPAAAPAAEKAIWGPTALPNGASAFPLYRQLGVDTYQLQLRWAHVARSRPANPEDPADPAYAWPADVSQALSQAPAQGIRVALLVTGAPGWANGGRGETWAPDDAQDFARFLTAASRKYPAVRRWMIWGEPNMAVRFQPTVPNDPTSARRYSLVLDAAYGALKRVSARNIVIGGMTWTGGDVKPAPFVAAMRLPDGRRPRLDWFGHNPYPFRYPDLQEKPFEGGWRDMSDLDMFTGEVQRAFGSRRKRVPLWLSEYMIQSDRPSQAFPTFVSRANQARWLTAGYAIADRLGDAVKGVGWFSLVDQPGANGALWGLVDVAGAPKPAFRAFERAPSRRLRPRVDVPRRASRAGGIPVRVRLRSRGRARVELQRRGGVVRAARAARSSRSARVRLRTAGLRPGTYVVAVKAPRAETVRRTVRVR